MFERKNFDLTIVTALFAVTMVFFNCSAGKRVKEDWQAIQLIRGFPVSVYKENNDIKVFTVRDTVSIYYYKNYILYKLAPKLQFESNQRIEGSESYFLYQANKDLGYYFDSQSDTTYEAKIGLDSFLNQNGLKGRDFDTPPDSLWKLVASLEDGYGQKTFLQEKYAFVKQQTEMDFDSIYYYYSKSMKDINYSFSKKLDSAKKMKLYKIRLLYDEAFSSKYSAALPKREFLFEIKELSSENKKEVIDLIENFIKRINNS